MDKVVTSKEARAMLDEGSEFSPVLLAVGAEGAGRAAAEAGARAAELVDAWVRAKNAAAVASLAEDEKAAAPARKAARRGLAILKARGVPIPERQHVARIGGDAEFSEEAWFLSPDASGASGILLCRRWKSGRNELVRVAFRDGVGLLEIQALQVSGSNLKAMLADLGRRLGIEPASVRVDWARARLGRARQENVTSGSIVPLGVDAQADLLGPVPAVPPPHPIDEAGLTLPDPASVVARSGDLHAEPEFAGWLPGAQAVQALLYEIGKGLQGGGAQPSQSQFDAAIRDAIDTVTDLSFSVDARERLAALMKDAAISLLARRGRELAAEVLAVAEAVRTAGLITSPPHEVPFLRAFFQKALSLIASQNNGQLSIPVPAGAADSLDPSLAAAGPEAGPTIISPAEAAAEKAAPGEKVSPGGIILP